MSSLAIAENNVKKIFRVLRKNDALVHDPSRYAALVQFCEVYALSAAEMAG
jgi:hypothetical protein